MTTYTLSLFINIQSPANFDVSHSTTKVDSVKNSVFQRVGLAYREFDLIAERISDNPYAAKSRLVTQLLNAGLSKDRTELLLAAKSWEDRMWMTWAFLNTSDRKKARTLNYDAVENYWPTVDFQDPKWSYSRQASKPALEVI